MAVVRMAIRFLLEDVVLSDWRARDALLPTSVNRTSWSCNAGAYLILITISDSMLIQIGGLGMNRFERGLYAYIGSARGRGAQSIEGRLRRHFQAWRKPFWHIDYLLNSKRADCMTAISASSERSVECSLNKAVLNLALRAIPYFGSSDCRKGCGSHLSYFGEARVDKVMNPLIRVFQFLGLKPCLEIV